MTDPDPITGIDEAKQCSEYLWVDGVTYTNSGTYTTTLLSYTGCDSLVTLYLTINQPSATTITDTITQGETYDFIGQNLTTAGIYTATLQNAAGCDSVVTLTLSVEQGFDCSISSTNDIICQGESVTLTSAASGVLPSVNYSLDFPNTAQYSGNAQAIGSTNKDGFNLTGDFTIEFWIKAEGSFYWHLMGKNTFGNNSQGWLLKKPSNNLMMAWTYVPDEFDFHPFSLGQWEHIAICFDDDANVFRYFKNGNLVSTEFRDINVNVSPYDLVIGHELGTGNWFDGKLDNLRISNVSRYSGSFNPSQTFVNDASVIAMYDFNEGSGNVAQDLSGNGRVLDLFNTNFSSDVPGGSSINQSAILWSNGSQDQTIIVAPQETTTYSVTVTQGNQTCTSEVTITVNQPSDTTITATINQGEIYSFNGQDLTTAGTYTATLQNAAGCDSLVTFNLEVNQNPINCQAIATNNAICQGESSDLAVVISGTSGSISNQQGFFEDFNDCNLDNFTFSGGSISITQDAFEGSCAVGMTHFAGESPNNFYPSGLNFHYGTYSVMANATAFISDNLMYLFQGDDLEGGLRVFSLPNNTDNPGFYVQGLGIDYYSGLVNVSSGQWYEMKVEIFPSIINVFINNELKFSTSQFEAPSPGRFKLGVAFSGIYDNMRFVPFGNSSSVLWSTGETTPSISVSPIETTTYSVSVTQGNQTCTSELTITVNQPSATTITDTINQGEMYDFNGQNLTTAGMYTANLQNATGCDSLVTLYLQVISNQSAKHTCGADNVHNAELQYGSMIDQQGNTYKTIVIGTQEWMAENLKTSIYRNGDAIANVTGDVQWIGLTTGAWCYYNNDSQYDCPYGKLYNWYAVDDSRNVCPTGWHVPTDAEWTTLTSLLGGLGVAGGKMKSTGLQYWFSPNEAATNESGFSGLPGGTRDSLIDLSESAISSFDHVGFSGSWWSSTKSSNTQSAWYRFLTYFGGNAYRSTFGQLQSGFSVRCLRDQPASGRLEETSTIQGIN
ncbi:MAG: FISUMP domain-containing protein, partial [Bacteroidota bacterium]